MSWLCISKLSSSLCLWDNRGQRTKARRGSFPLGSSGRQKASGRQKGKTGGSAKKVHWQKEELPCPSSAFWTQQVQADSRDQWLWRRRKSVEHGVAPSLLLYLPNWLVLWGNKWEWKPSLLERSQRSKQGCALWYLCLSSLWFATLLRLIPNEGFLVYS